MAHPSGKMSDNTRGHRAWPLLAIVLAVGLTGCAVYPVAPDAMFYPPQYASVDYGYGGPGWWYGRPFDHGHHGLGGYHDHGHGDHGGHGGGGYRH